MESVYINEDGECRFEGWMASGKLSRFVAHSISFDDDCVIYVGTPSGGYIVYDHSTGLAEPSAFREPNDQTYLAGWDPYNAYAGAGNVERILAWSGGKPTIVGTVKVFTVQMSLGMRFRGHTGVSLMRLRSVL